MNEALELLLQIIENSKDGGELPILNTLASNKSFLVWDPDVSKFKLISKSAITFTGEPPSKTTDLTDFPDSLLGQKGKIAKIKEDESGWEFVVLADVTGVTQTELNTAIEGANAYAESLLGGQASPTRIDSWVLGYDSGLTFNPTFNFTVDGVSKTDSRQITLAAADPTNPRKDTFVVNIQTEQIEVLTGTPSPNPAEPDVDFSIYLKGATVDIPAGATTPANINIKTLYDENLGTAGGEAATSGGVDFDFDNTENPSSGTKAIKVVGDLSVSQAIVLSLGIDLPIADAKEIQLDIQNITAGGNFHVTLLGKKSNGRTESYILPAPTGFDPANITSYQTITQSISTNQLVSIYAVQIVNEVAGFKFYLDKVRFLGGEGTSAPTGDYVTRTEFETLDSEVVKSVSTNGGTPVLPDPSGNVDLTVSEGSSQEYTGDVVITANTVLADANKRNRFFVRDAAVIAVPNALTSTSTNPFKLLVVKETDKTVSFAAGKDVVFEFPSSKVAVIFEQYNAAVLEWKRTENGIKYYGIYGALEDGTEAGELTLEPPQTSVNSIAWPEVYLSADYPEFTTSKKYFTIYSSDHSGSGGGIYAGEFDDLEFNGFTELGAIVTGLQSEFPWLQRRDTAKTGIADPLLLFYHTNTSDPRNTTGKQESHTLSTSGGNQIHLCTWTDRGKPIVLEAGDMHTGYMRTFDKSDGTLVCHHLTIGGDPGEAAVATLDTGLTFTRKEVMDETQGMPAGGTFGRFSVNQFTRNSIDYSFIDYRDPQGTKHLAFSQLDGDMLPINVTEVLTLEYEDHVARIEGDFAYIYIRPGAVGIGQNPEGYFLHRIYIPDFI